jgi:hypothetical protein
MEFLLLVVEVVVVVESLAILGLVMAEHINQEREVPR